MASTRIVYIEPFSGISGDMMLGALLDLGLDFGRLEQELSRLNLEGYRLSRTKCQRAGIQATKLDVHCEGEASSRSRTLSGHADHKHRSFRDIQRLIESSELSAWVKEKSIEAFRRLAQAEGKIHDRKPEEVVFHEVGALDSIVDIVGSMIVAEQLLPARFLSSAVNVGEGTLQCRHGFYPVPGPATQELLLGVPTYSNGVDGELTTPTGATLLATLVERFGSRPMMRIRSSGYGAGTRETPGNANVLRITVGEEIIPGEAISPQEQVVVIEATIDDMNPQIYGYFQEKALGSGALDVYATPIQTKKNRPALILTVVCSIDRLDSLSRLIFEETTTIGIRYSFAQRRTLERRFFQVATEYGTVRIKASFLDGRRMNFTPEYEDCCRLAEEKGVALKAVMAAANSAFLRFEKEEAGGVRGPG